MCTRLSNITVIVQYSNRKCWLAVRSNHIIMELKVPLLKISCLYMQLMWCFFLQNPELSLLSLNRILGQYTMISGCKINEGKSPVILYLIATEELKLHVKQLSVAEWKNKGIHYLESRILGNLNKWLESNITPFINKMSNQFANWQKLTVSWFGWMAIIKSNILPMLLFFLQNVIIYLPQKIINKVQELKNFFVGK